MVLKNLLKHVVVSTMLQADQTPSIDARGQVASTSGDPTGNPLPFAGSSQQKDTRPICPIFFPSRLLVSLLPGSIVLSDLFGKPRSHREKGGQ